MRRIFELRAPIQLSVQKTKQLTIGVDFLLHLTPYNSMLLLMAKQNIKISSETIQQLKQITQEQTGQKAVEAAISEVLRGAQQRAFVETLKQAKFRKNFDPLNLRRHDR